MEAIQAEQGNFNSQLKMILQRYRRIYSGNDTGGYTVETIQADIQWKRNNFTKKVSKKVYKIFSLIFQADFVKNQI